MCINVFSVVHLQCTCENYFFVFHSFLSFDILSPDHTKAAFILEAVLKSVLCV